MLFELNFMIYLGQVDNSEITSKTNLSSIFEYGRITILYGSAGKTFFNLSEKCLSIQLSGVVYIQIQFTVFQIQEFQEEIFGPFRNLTGSLAEVLMNALSPPVYKLMGDEYYYSKAV